jgi:hypothetical protein
MKIEQIDKNMAKSRKAGPEMKWHSPMDYPFRLSGFPWISKDKLYRRLPLNPSYKIPETVDILANHTAGGQIGFRTDSMKLAVRVRLSDISIMDHMASTGQGGFDCYIGEPKNTVFCGTTRFDPQKPEYECLLFEMKENKMRNIILNFPLYMGVNEVLVGLDEDAAVEPPPPYSFDKPVVFYGTSITQGGCASRPGMAYTNIIGRRLNVECINLGFSGSGKGEPELAHLIAEIENPACIVLDYEANAGSGLLEKTLQAFIHILRKKHTNVPIIVVSKIRFAKESFIENILKEREDLKSFQQVLVGELRESGDKHIHFVDGSVLLGENFDECTVDGVHPTDLGFMRIADNLTPIIADILRMSTNRG